MALWGSRRRREAEDEALIRSLYDEHGRAVLAYTARLTGDRSASEDVTQETFIRAWRNPDVLVNSKGSVRGWLLTVARNIVVDRARARQARPAEVAPVPGTEPPQDDHADSVVDSIVVMDALDSLSPDHRAVLVEVYFRKRSVAEAARVLGVPPGTVKSRSYHALQALRRRFGRRASPGEGRVR
ncbi:sigma-70 family RNA polymerase sigma factor [Nocardiopsis aegyptia]|uniref:RNA polymerase sigma-70 factor (ECF subfamily) n=1 Tax=Nocardiopsis aegyptia TaxID=220378 RepID=A0A7Z0JCT8_9ACTN|nr:sigma-70 family RNA polymerase sigma factor [Nocardiopsis aegyptia]NYJ37803.1 RNA polymerase sigma-70 factor (ECF subfamily) [Nocardiopsis aegyptia]